MNETKITTTQLSLPKGGGAIQGIGETFQPNLFTGTGNFMVPIFTSPGREGFGPQLSLQYSTGNGNGIFGLGWNLSIPRITRKTEKGLPQYNVGDVFVMSGAEDLVPKLKVNDSQAIDFEIFKQDNDTNTIKYRITRYLPRTEGLFARIELWEELDANNQVIDVFWRVTTKDNITSIYGRTPNARIKDPDNQSKIFEWLLEETFDAKGNHIYYEYACDDPELNIDRIYEQNRSYAQVYPRRILYGNVPNQLSVGVERQGTDPSTPVKTISRRYVYELIFDYGDEEKPDWEYPQNNEDTFVYESSDGAIEKFDDSIPIRNDAFSSFRAGFEIRTLRRCTHVFMIHHFKELGDAPTLIKSTDFSYTESTGTQVSLLTSATVTGYTKLNNDSYIIQSMPPVAFKYSEFRPQEQRYQSVKAKDGNLPALSLNDPNTALVDIFGNGLQDIVQTTTEGFRYWRNKGNGELESPQMLTESPAGLALANAGVSFGDMGGDGLADIIVNNGPVHGFFELQAERLVDGELKGGWSPESFHHYDNQPSINLSDPNLRMLDLTGDGLTDLLVTTDRYILWYQSKGEEGYEQQSLESKPEGLESLSFNDSSGRLRLADMTGDGLNDIVLVHNGRIDYWSNLGYGKFGKRLTMSGNTRLPQDFNPQRLFLADLDGSGTADLIYVDFNQVHFWFNQSGNSWSKQQTIDGTPITVDIASLSFTDFFGTGTTCLVWSYNAGTFSDGNYKVLDFCGGKKPYLLTQMNNNLGATTKVGYASSTKFYLEDFAQGNFWATSLPFPVQVVEKTETIDHISKTKLVTCYKYHHGFYDGKEREFRGFGRVDQLDTEEFEVFSQTGLHDGAKFTNKEKAFHVPPVLTKTWFHTGAYFQEKTLMDRYQAEYSNQEEGSLQSWSDSQAFGLGDHEYEWLDSSSDLSFEQYQEAHRSLRGSMLRQEVYSLDKSEKEFLPYVVTESRSRVKEIQPKQMNAHGVYLTTPLQSITYHYERNLADPRIGHEMTLEVDQFGNVLKSVAIAYPRRTPEYPEHGQTLVTYTQNRVTNKPDEENWYLIGVPIETQIFEITGIDTPPAQSFKITDFYKVESDQTKTGYCFAPIIDYEETPTTGQIQKRRIEWVRTLYRANDQASQLNSSCLPLGEVDSLALPCENLKVAFTSGLLRQVYSDKLNNRELELRDLLEDDGKYLEQDGHWWIPSGRQAFDPTQFYLVTQVKDPFEQISQINYDTYSLLTIQTVDPLGNTVRVRNNYRTLQPEEITDPNSNLTQVAFDALGMVAGTAVMGKLTSAEGDSLDNFATDLTQQQLDDFFQNPLSTAGTLLGNATTRIVYDLDRFINTGEPVFAATLARETHVSELTAGEETKIQVSFTYSDGFGREIQQKIQAEPGLAPVRDDQGVLRCNQNLQPTDPRWVGTGRTIFNNKGKPVKQYEPFFSSTHIYEDEADLVQCGVTSIIHYDPLERVIRTDFPNGTFSQVEFDSWHQETWDENDTVLESQWYADRGSPAPIALEPSDRETRAAWLTTKHANTPTIAHLDTLGRVFRTVVNNGTFGEYETLVELDIEGNDLSITDPRGIQAFIHIFDIAGRKLCIDSKDAGLKTILLAVDDQPIKTWDANGHSTELTYDALRRPSQLWATESGQSRRLVQNTVYGESAPDGVTNNLRGKAYEIYDEAGVVRNVRYDFKGNLERSTRQLLADYKSKVDWLQTPPPPLEGISPYATEANFDALNRVVTSSAPDGSLYKITYNEANLLEQVVVRLWDHTGDRLEPETTFVENVDYNAKGQRLQIQYGNGVVTKYTYDDLTYRLTRMTSQKADGTQLQDLHYTYDPVGNITQIEDRVFSTVFNHNQRIDPINRYTYDPIYRLIKASGREHEQMGPCHYSKRDQKQTEIFVLTQQPINNGQALRNYTETYTYDDSGNITRMHHLAKNGGSWSRNQTYAADSNRLSISDARCPEIDSFSYTHDENGNITAMPHLSVLVWDYANRLVQVTNNGNGGARRKAFYNYDTGGQRIRKVIERGDKKSEERIYLGGFEIHRSYNTSNGNLTLERQSLHVMDDQKRIALVETRTEGNDNSDQRRIRYQLDNHLGSSLMEINENGEVISYEEYYSYGGTAYLAGENEAEVKRKRYRYSGKERDDETGLYYYGARYYAPWLGRWMSCDPAVIIDGLNLYHFVNLNPVHFLDKEGTQSEENSAQPTPPELEKPKIHLIIIGSDAPESSGHSHKAGDKSFARRAKMLLGEETEFEKFPDRVDPQDKIIAIYPPSMNKDARNMIYVTGKKKFGDKFEIRKVKEKELHKELKKIKNVKSFFYFGHGTTGVGKNKGPLYEWNPDDSLPDPKDLPSDFFSGDAKAFIITCNSEEYAKKLTEHHGINTVGATGETQWWGWYDYYEVTGVDDTKGVEFSKVNKPDGSQQIKRREFYIYRRHGTPFMRPKKRPFNRRKKYPPKGSG